MSAYLRRCTQLRNIFIVSRQISRFSCANKNFNFLKGTPESTYGKRIVFGRTLATVAPKFENGEEQVRVSESLPADEFIDQLLSKIDSEAKRYGHIVRKDVEAVFGRIKNSGMVSSIQSLYLIRCCGSLLCFETPPQRIALVNEIWSKLQEFGTPMDVSHYNSLLKCYLENEHQFSPPEFLAAMERKGITPNRVTYQCVIEKYCQDGDLNSASAILEHMKEKNFSINESTFNSLVLGHARAKDMQGAVNILEVMRNSHLEPTSETYATLACGYAGNGDIEGFVNVLREVGEKELYFSMKSSMKMVLSLADSGNSEHINRIFAEMDVRNHKPEAINAAVSLIDKGHHDVAYKIIQLVAATGFHRVFYHFFKGLALKGQSFDKILPYCQDSFEKGTYEYIYEDALKTSILYGNIDNALEILKEMKKLGRPVRCHYFWPILATHARNGNLEGIWSTLKVMSDMALPADSDTYVDYVFPHVPTSDLLASIPKIRELGQSDAVASDALFFYFCINGQMKAAADFCKEYKPEYNLFSIINVLANGKHDDTESVVKLLKQLREEMQDHDSRDDVFGLFFKRLFYHRPNNIPLLERYIQEYNAQGIKLPSMFVETLCMHLKGPAPELVRPVRNLEINVIRDQHMHSDYIPPREMELEQLEKRLANIKETGENVRPVLRHLFSQYCREKNLDRALEIKAEMDAINFTYSPAAYALLVNLYVAHDKLEEAMMYKKEIDVLYPHFKLDAAKGLEYVALMIRCDKIDEAFEIIKNEAKDWLSPRYNDLLVTGVRNVLHAAADTGSVETTQKLFQIFVQDLNFVPLHHTILEPLIKVHLIRNDVDTAIEEYRKCVVNHNIYPSRNYLFKKFIASKDHERLQKVVDISTTYGGKDRALHELAAAFIEAGCVQEARKVIQTLGTKADTNQLGMICYRFFKQDKVLELEQLIGITKDLYHVDRDQLYMHLLNLYVQSNDHQSALEMWNGMQEENVQPSALTLQKLAELLEKNDQPIPFIVPANLEPQDYVCELWKPINEKNEVEIVDVLKRMKKGEVHALTPDVFSKIVDVLVEKRSLKEIVDIVQVMSCILSKPAEILRPIAVKYGEAGDVDAMKMLYDCLPDFAHKYMHFTSNCFEAYLVSGQPEAILDELEKNVDSSKKLFSVNGYLKLLENYPELHDRAIKLADMYDEKQKFDTPKAALWLYYFLQEKYDEAQKIYKKHSSAVMKTDYLFARIMKAVRSTQNEVLGRNLIEVANETLKANIKSRAYSCLLDVLVNKEKLEEAVALIEEANSKGVPTEKILHPTLVNLRRSLTEKNMPVPFTIQSEGENSSSSDDSD